MSSRTVTIVGYVASISILVILQALGSLPDSKIPPFSAIVRRMMRTRAGRVGLLTAWAWIGLHFFAR